ncbi:hypothetical protein QRZ28_26345 [Raoultella ornithinolytica]|uniref:deaminase n=1 Tax=Raoultella ornithinolytica TaxID=54291 RepID=UPI00255AC38E|nr:deaminase [Raoultella ornithinolytica]MDL4585370.1 hypothetical protein [Raoultella ornithinolytica]HEC2564933.1 hypothetical protein [Raoultella ornithinolytica]
MPKIPKYFDPASAISKFWDEPLNRVAFTEFPSFSTGEVERHTIYSLAVMALVAAYWNGNKRGSREGVYLYRDKQRRDDGTYKGDRAGDRYFGHNIAAIAVDANGDIIDFDFNHNELFNSSVEHAEARLVHRLFKLNSVNQSWDVTTLPVKYSTDLKNTTIYTSLESCAQCSGIMNLARLNKVIYLQPDPGQFMIGQIIYNLSESAPIHIPAGAFGFQYYDLLTKAYQDYLSIVSTDKPFFVPVNSARVDVGKAITSFLCTDFALDIYKKAVDELNGFSCVYRDYAPINNVTGSNAKSNSQVLDGVKVFIDYVVNIAQRGTPH